MDDQIRVGVFDPERPDLDVGAYFTTHADVQRRAQLFDELIYFQIFKHGVDPDES